jgi:hypothetical protein
MLCPKERRVRRGQWILLQAVGGASGTANLGQIPYARYGRQYLPHSRISAKVVQLAPCKLRPPTRDIASPEADLVLMGEQN